MEPNKEGLKKEIGVWGLSANIVNLVIGAGIFVLPAIVAESLGASGLLAYLFCGLLIILIMLCFAEVGSKVTRSGGLYSYVEVAFGKFAGFLVANIFILGVCVTSDAAIINALSDTLSYIWPVFNERIFRSFFILIVFSLLIWINIRGVKEGISLVKITTLAKLGPLFAMVILGAFFISPENLSWEFTPTIRNFGEASLVLFFAFQGAEAGLNISGEVKNPEKTIPKAIFIGILVILIFYLLIQFTAQGVLGSSLPQYPEAPLAETAKKMIGPWGIVLILIGTGVSMFGTLSGEVLNNPRIIFRAAKDDVLPPKVLATVHGKYATPHIAILAYGILACILALIGEFKQMAIISVSGILLVYLGVALSVIKLRFSPNHSSGTFRIPGGITIPVLAILTILWFLSNLKKNEFIGMAIFILALTTIYYTMRALRTGRSQTVSRPDE